MSYQLISGDARHLPLPDESVQMVVTSPPYWNMRDYQAEGQIGLEATFAGYLDEMMLAYQEIWRVLRKDGTFWLNLGDSYAANRSYQVPDSAYRDVGNKKGLTVGACNSTHVSSRHNPGFRSSRRYSGFQNSPAAGSIKGKDLIGIPWRTAFRLQEAGWWLRSDCIWNKLSPMPESVTDRPTKAHEYIFLFSKSPKYFYDSWATREPLAESTRRDKRLGCSGTQRKRYSEDQRGACPSGMTGGSPSGRNKRTVWTFPSESFAGKHYASYPKALVTPCVLAGTSEKGCCSACGAPWKRIVEKTGGMTGKGWHQHEDDLVSGQSSIYRADGGSEPYRVESVGWQPGCTCEAGIKPCTILDPFVGSGTSIIVAEKYGRDSIGVDISEAYLAMAQKRIESGK